MWFVYFLFVVCLRVKSFIRVVIHLTQNGRLVNYDSAVFKLFETFTQFIV